MDRVICDIDFLKKIQEIFHSSRSIGHPLWYNEKEQMFWKPKGCYFTKDKKRGTSDHEKI